MTAVAVVFAGMGFVVTEIAVFLKIIISVEHKFYFSQEDISK